MRVLLKGYSNVEVEIRRVTLEMDVGKVYVKDPVYKPVEIPSHRGSMGFDSQDDPLNDRTTSIPVWNIK